MNASFVYDGDGKRVKSTLNGATTYFAGTYFELTSSTVTKYYEVYPAAGGAGSQRIALHSGAWDHSNPVTGTLNFVLGDHLGSTSLTTDANGQTQIETRYKACPFRFTSGVLRKGEVRYASGTSPTHYQYTGQFNEADFGLYFYNARWLDVSLGRFAQADTIGVYRNGRLLLRNSNSIGFAEIVFGLGIPGDMPIAGNWDGLQ